MAIEPSYADAYFNLAAALASVGQFQATVRNCRKVLQIAPDSADACNLLAWLEATCADASIRNGAEAVRLATRAVDLAAAGSRGSWIRWRPPMPRRVDFPTRCSLLAKPSIWQCDRETGHDGSRAGQVAALRSGNPVSADTALESAFVMPAKPTKRALREKTGDKAATRGIGDSSVARPGMAAPPLGRSRQATALATGLLVLATIAAYSNSFGGVLILDDEPWIVNNPAIRQLWPIQSWLLPQEALVRGRPVIGFRWPSITL